VSNEPKRVRTVTIRPDGDASGRPVGDAKTAPGRAAPNARITTNSTSPRAPARGEPLSLDPTAQAEAPQARAPTPPPASRDNSARPTSEQWDPAPRESRSSAPKLASAPTNGDAGGGYVVQVSSQRTESDARASYRGLQQKYPQLKSREPIIRRAELGSKGTYYRAMIGPFESANEAGEFCSGLKRAGGQCIILRN
jgi:cell division protein FtsN